MPLARYFLLVGSVLLALLFIADAYSPKLPPAGTTDALPPAIRVHSGQKWPERVVFDTSAPMPGAALTAKAEADSSVPSTIAAGSPGSREAFAELRTTEARLPASSKQPEARPQRERRVARKRAPRPMLFAARRPPPPFGWFGPAIW